MLIFLLFVVVVNFCACSCATDLTVKANDRVILPENTNAAKTPSSSDTQIIQKTNSDLLKSEYPIVFSGFVTLENREAAIPVEDWTLVNADILHKLEQNEPPAVDDKTFINVDIMSCAGYLGSGLARYDAGNGAYWKIQMLAETVPTNIAERGKQCSSNNHSAAQDESITILKAFAVEAKIDKRRNIKIKQVDTRKLFATLPKEIQQQLNNKYNVKTRKRNNLSLPNDNWTDIDGDGQIDLVELSVNCGNYQCSSVLYLLKDKWIKIGEVQPA